MNLNEIDALRYALRRTLTTLYPKQYAYEEIVIQGGLNEKEFTSETLETLRNFKNEINLKMKQRKDQEFAYLHFLLIIQ